MTLEALGCLLGLGVLLSWVSLAVLYAAARPRARSEPGTGHRLLVGALLLSSAMIVLPMARFAGTGLAPRAAPAPTLDLARPPTPEAEHPGRAESRSKSIDPRLAGAPSIARQPAVRLASCTLALAWLALAVAGLGGFVRARRRLERLVASGTEPPVRWRRALTELAAEIGVRAPRLVVTRGPPSPFLYGAWRPTIGIPEPLLGLERDALELCLRHELWHLARGDHRSAPCVHLASRAFVGHPLLPRLLRDVARCREQAVDDLAAREAPMRYAQFLLQLAEERSAPSGLTLAAVPMASSTLAARIERLIDPPETESRWRGSLATVAVGLLVLAGGCYAAPTDFEADSSAEETTDAEALGGPPDSILADPLVDSRLAFLRGKLDGAEVERAFAEHRDEIAECHRRAPASRRTIASLHFEIDEEGRPRLGHVDGAAELAPCLDGVLNRMRFTAPEEGRATVVHRLEFRPGLVANRALQISGRLPPEVIRRVLRSQFGTIRACHAKITPLPSGTITLHFTIGEDGRVVEGHADAEQVPEMKPCMERFVRNLWFPEPEGGPVTVVYPVVVSSE